MSENQIIQHANVPHGEMWLLQDRGEAVITNFANEKIPVKDLRAHPILSITTVFDPNDIGDDGEVKMNSFITYIEGGITCTLSENDAEGDWQIVTTRSKLNAIVKKNNDVCNGFVVTHYKSPQIHGTISEENLSSIHKQLDGLKSAVFSLEDNISATLWNIFDKDS